MPRAVFARFAALLVIAGGCSASAGSAPRPAEPDAVVVVENQAWVDVDVFVVYGGTRSRLGMVTGNSERRFTLRPAVVGRGRDVRFLADPVGSERTAESFEIYVAPGQEVRLTIPSRVGQ